MTGVTSPNKSLGVGQTWQDKTAERLSGVTYTNTTGRTIKFTVHLVNSSGEVGARIFIEGVETQEERERNTSSSNNLTVSEIVPAGASYMVVATIGSIETFYELR